MFKFKRIRWKFTATCISLVILSMLILGLFLQHSLGKYYYHALETQLKNEARLIAHLVKDMPDSWNRPTMEKIVDQIGNDINVRVTIIDLDGTVLGDSKAEAAQMENHLTSPELQQARADGLGMSIRYSNTLDRDMMYVAVPILTSDEVLGFVRLAVSLDTTGESLFDLWSVVFLAILLVLLLTLPVSFILGRRVTKPLERLIEFARRISKGDYDHRVSIKSNDEIGELAENLDEMAATIKEKVRQVTESKNKLEAVLANMTSGVIFVDKEGRISLVNPTAEKYLAFLAPKNADIPHSTSIRDPKLSSGINEALQTGKLVQKQLKILVPREMTLEVTISPFLDEEERLNGVVAVLHDITQIRKLEKMRTEFVDNVSHELKTPVTAIKGFTETLLDGAMYERETCREFIEIINQEAGRLSRLIQDLLDLSRIEFKRVNAKRRKVDLLTIMRHTVVKMQGHVENSNLKLILNLPEKTIPVKVDSDMIEQVLFNLIENAIKYTTAQGQITLEVDESEKNITVWVRDTGVGIPREDLDRVFERFYRVDKTRSRAMGGTGLGLSIVKHIIDFHGGSVGVESTSGIGSNFYFILPKVHE